jgi:hypothetical protein
MVQFILVGLCAGVASALLFASGLQLAAAVFGSFLAILVFSLSPLPILIAALAWSHWSALVAALTGAAALTIFFNGYAFITFLISIGLPAWWLGYLTLLARPAAHRTDEFEWYPTGQLVLWAAVLGAAVVIVAVFTLGTDEETFRAQVRKTFERAFQSPQVPTSGENANANNSKTIDLFVVIIPPAAAMLATFTNVLNLWLAGRIAKVSSRLRRPWPDITALRFPVWTPVLLAMAVVGSFLPNLLGICAGILAASLLIAYAMLGFAILHVLTRGRAARGFILGGSYIAALIFGWPLLLMSLLGLADTVFDLRTRKSAGASPPSSS